MDYKTIQNVKLPVLGLGTWHMGLGGKDVQEVAAIKAAIELEITHIDTAETYSQGHSEELVGKAIKDLAREKLFITTKVSPSHFHYDQVIQACKASLDRLETSFIDLYLLHWPNEEVDLKETMEAMDYLVDQGLILHIGVSNFSVQLMKEASTHSKNRLFANQVDYSLFELSPEEEILPYCQDHDICVTAYSPLGRGRIGDLESNTVIQEFAKHYGKTPVQIALNYLISQDRTIAIPKSSDIEHIKEIVGSVGWKMSKEELQKLRTEFEI